MIDYLASNQQYTKPVLWRSMLTADDQIPVASVETIALFTLKDGTQVTHTISRFYGIGWCIRHARGIGNDPRCLSWQS